MVYKELKINVLKKNLAKLISKKTNPNGFNLFLVLQNYRPRANIEKKLCLHIVQFC